MPPKISVIVPIYNAGEYLSRCLTSLSKQTLTDIEIICVLDCPTDGSDKVVKQYAQFDSRFVVVENEQNIGVAASRNKGIELAKGEYVGFSDHDDWCEPVMYEALYSRALTDDYDVVLSDTFIELPKERKIIHVNTTDSQQILFSLLLPEDSSHCVNKLARSVWHSIYRRDFIMDNHVVFYDRKKYLEEDTLFNCQVFARAPHVTVCHQAYYHWNLRRQTEQSQYGQHFQIAPFCNYFRMIKQYVKDEELLEEVMTSQFYLYWSYYRKIEDRVIVKSIGSDIDYLKPYAILRVYGWLRLIKSILVYYKFVCYISKLKKLKE